MVALARTKRSKLDSTSTLRDADFFSIERERKSRPSRSDSVDALLWTWERNSGGEKVVEERRKRLPVVSLVRSSPE
jgi:hypothetical protein